MGDGDGEPPSLPVRLGHDLSGGDELELRLPGAREDDRVALLLLAGSNLDLADFPVDPVLVGPRAGALHRSLDAAAELGARHWQSLRRGRYWAGDVAGQRGGRAPLPPPVAGRPQPSEVGHRGAVREDASEVCGQLEEVAQPVNGD